MSMNFEREFEMSMKYESSRAYGSPRNFSVAYGKFSWNEVAWDFSAEMCCGENGYVPDKCKDNLVMGLTCFEDPQKITMSGAVVGCIYVMKHKTHDYAYKYYIQYTRIGAMYASFELSNVTYNIVPLMSEKILRFRLTLHFLEDAKVSADYKVLKPYTNLTVIVGETKFYISKEILACVSPIFDAMLFDEKNDKNEITLSDVTSAEFGELLKVMQSGSRMDIPWESVLGVLKLALKYRMDSIVDICENRWISRLSWILHDKKYFSIACEHGLLRLQHKFIMAWPLHVLPRYLDESPINPKSNEVMKMVSDRLISDRGMPARAAPESNPFMALDFKTPKPFTNLVILVNGSKLYASKEVLASVSPVFAAMLYGNFEENKRNEIAIDDVDAAYFEMLLKVVHPGSRLTVNGQNVIGLLKLADKYLIESLTTICENFLATDYLGVNASMARHLYLVVASDYRLRRLPSIFIMNCDPTELRALLDNDLFDSLSVDVSKMVVDRLWSCSGDKYAPKTWSERASNDS